MLITRLASLTLAGAIALSPLTAVAQDGEAAIEAREGAMNVLGLSLGTIGGMAKGEVEYDAEAATAAAENLAAIASLNLGPLFPEGTSSDDMEDSRALPAVWAEWDEFQSQWDDLGAAADGLVDVAADGQEGLGAALGPIGQACGSCHRQFRQSN
ncbi:cytochrome c [Tropicimonas sp. IMCC34011]|uniref:c-type cytochrome n=1 Tax=Tropicimonas sp. IMCC34011 TaxID=2248759 RepID=UPI000E236F9E|nr:cytochrome c [Tropicimonas sp. IMCC34011]